LPFPLDVKKYQPINKPANPMKTNFFFPEKILNINSILVKKYYSNK